MKNVIKDGRLVDQTEDTSSYDDSYEVIDFNGGAVGDLWNGINFETPPVATVELVKEEASKRIVSLVGNQIEQINQLAEITAIQEVAKSSRTQAQKDRITEQQTKWAYITAVRTASNEIEAMDPIPADFTDDKYWPAKP